MPKADARTASELKCMVEVVSRVKVFCVLQTFFAMTDSSMDQVKRTNATEQVNKRGAEMNSGNNKRPHSPTAGSFIYKCDLPVLGAAIMLTSRANLLELPGHLY